MKRFEGIISADYDLVPQSVPSFLDLEDRLAELIAFRYAAPTVLDVGIGTGITTQAILGKNRRAIVRAVDNEPSMVDQARRRLEHEVSIGTVEIHERDAVEYMQTVEVGSFDVVASSYTLHNCFAEYRSLLHREIFRLLRVGGMFINNDKYASDDRNEYIRELTDQIVRYDILTQIGRDDLRKLWVQHELEDQLPERIMWARESVESLRRLGFADVGFVEKVGQYSILAAYKRLKAA